MCEIVKIKDATPNKDVVNDLKVLLTLALSGELTGFACAYQFKDGVGDSCYSPDPNGRLEVLIAQAGALHLTLQMTMIPEDTDV